MDKNLNNIAGNLYSQLQTRFPNVELRDENEGIIELGKKVNGVPVTEKSARSFIFDFTDDNVPLTSVKIDLSNEHGLIVSYSNEIDDTNELAKQKFFSFLKDLRNSMKSVEPQFTVRVLGRDNLEKRDIGESQMNESKLWGTSRVSYQNIGEAKLLIKHSRPINHDLPAGRAMHIESIHVENAQGERFLYPYKHLNGARALAQHISNGGTSYDAVGQHVIGLSEELSKLRMFKQYVNRNEMISEAMGAIQTKVLERIDTIKKEIHQLQNESYYKNFVESFTVRENQEIPEEILNDWVERLTIKTFNEELKNVFPYIYKLVGEDNLPIKELTVEDLMADEEEQQEEKTQPSLAELDEYESFLEDVTDGVGLFSKNPEQQEQAVEKLNDLLVNNEDLFSDVDGVNLQQSLEGVLGDDEIEELVDVFKEMDDLSIADDAAKTQMVKDVLKDYIQLKDIEHGTQISSKVNFGESPVLNEPPEIAPAAAPVVPQPAPQTAAPVDMIAMAQSAAAPVGMAAPVPPVDMTATAPPAIAPMQQPLTASVDNDSDIEKYDSGWKEKEKEPKDEFGNPIKHRAKHLAGRGVRAMLKKLAAKGVKPEDTITLNDGREFNIKEIAEMTGIKLEDVFDSSKGSKQEIVEFIKSMYDPIAKAFPKGQTGVMLAVEKKFGEDAAAIAERVISELTVFQESLAMRRLAGLEEDADFPIDQVLEEASNPTKVVDQEQINEYYNPFQIEFERARQELYGRVPPRLLDQYAADLARRRLAMRGGGYPGPGYPTQPGQAGPYDIPGYGVERSRDSKEFTGDKWLRAAQAAPQLAGSILGLAKGFGLTPQQAQQGQQPQQPTYQAGTVRDVTPSQSQSAAAKYSPEVGRVYNQLTDKFKELELMYLRNNTEIK